jgi:hypothetical protein
MKKTTTKTTKKQKAEVWFDMSDGNYGVSDIVARITLGKVVAGLPITESQLNNIINYAANEVLASLFTWNNAVMRTNNGYVKLNLNVMKTTPKDDVPATDTDDNVDEQGPSEDNVGNMAPEIASDVKKKNNIFMRFWNWITGK